MFSSCRCLYEMENNLPRTQYCFVPCQAQMDMLRERESETEQGKKNQKISEGIDELIVRKKNAFDIPTDTKLFDIE